MKINKYFPFVIIFLIIVVYTLIVLEFSKPLVQIDISSAINDFIILLTCLLGLFFVIKIIENRRVGRILIWGLYLIFLGLYSVFLNDFYQRFVFLKYFSVFDIVAVGLFLFVYGIAKWAKIIQENDQVKLLNQELTKKSEEMGKFSQFSIDRELKMIELKKEVNKLLKKLGEKPRYNIE